MSYVPDKLLARRKKDKVSQTARELFEFYCEMADAFFGVCYPSLEYVARETEIRLDNLRGYDRELQKANWIKVFKTPAGREVRALAAGWEPVPLRGKKFAARAEAEAAYTAFFTGDDGSLRFSNLVAKTDFFGPDSLNFSENLLNFRLDSLNFSENLLNFRDAYKEYNSSRNSTKEPVEEEGTPPPPPLIDSGENFSSENPPASVKTSVPSANLRPDIVSDADYLLYLKADPRFKNLPVTTTYRRMIAWCGENKKPPNRFRLLKWLERDLEDLPMTEIDFSDSADLIAAPPDCARCGGTGRAEERTMTGEFLFETICDHRPLIPGEYLWIKKMEEENVTTKTDDRRNGTNV